ncbi:ATP-binding protein [Thermaurantiacus tibetensis]|uniref:ATP-binding protein n=1 Tax=Thermaurantiacus tibetensis TaxID=2759035 RepID=UPI00188E3AE3|nr:ATP-binding protein [Thermaurantiacus tibetensis]
MWMLAAPLAGAGLAAWLAWRAGSDGATVAAIGALSGLGLLPAVTLRRYHVASRTPMRDEGEVTAKAESGARPVSSDLVSIAALAEPAIVVSGSWRAAAANEQARTLFGPRVAGSDVRQSVRHPAVLDALRQAMGGESPATREVGALGHADGAFRVRVVALGEERYLVTFTDITQARLAERMRADFVANASHELRTPLANISGFIETLLGPAAEDEPARRRFLEIMAKESARMSRLIDDLLSLSRIELDKYVRPQAPLDLAPLLADVGKTLAMRLEADGRRLLIDVAEGLPQVVGDRDQILQVLHNLVSNALKYGHSGTPIRLSAAPVAASARMEEMVRVSVEDVGDGIAPEHLPRLTERFYRVDTGRSRSMGGTGLGLAIVKHIVERHRGRLEISSRQGEGTTVSFTLPVVPKRIDERVAEGGEEGGAATPDRGGEARHKTETKV